MKVLVTGGCGFIGHHVVDELLRRGHSPIVVDNLSTGTARPNRPYIEADFHAVTVPNVDATIHLAATSSIGAATKDPFKAWFNNVERTVKLQGSVVFASSGAVYGDRFGPLSIYAQTKLAAEMGLRTLNPQAKIRRLGNVYGPGQRPDLEAGVVAKWMKLLLDDPAATLPVTGTGTQTRDFVYVVDVAKALVDALDEAAIVADVGRGVSTSILELAKALWLTVHGVDRPKIELISRPSGEVEFTRLEGCTQTQTNLLTGLAETWRWWQTNSKTG